MTDLMAWVIVGYTLGGVCAVLEAARWLWMEKCGGRRRAKARQDRYEEAFIENLPAFFEGARKPDARQTGSKPGASMRPTSAPPPNASSPTSRD